MASTHTRTRVRAQHLSSGELHDVEAGVEQKHLHGAHQNAPARDLHVVRGQVHFHFLPDLVVRKRQRILVLGDDVRDLRYHLSRRHCNTAHG